MTTEQKLTNLINTVEELRRLQRWAEKEHGSGLRHNIKMKEREVDILLGNLRMLMPVPKRSFTPQQRSLYNWQAQ